MIWAIGLPSTKAVSTFTGRPRWEAMLATLVSAEVACIVKRRLLCTGWPLSGVIRTPMLVGVIIAQAASCRSSMMWCSPSGRFVGGWVRTPRGARSSGSGRGSGEQPGHLVVGGQQAGY